MEPAARLALFATVASLLATAAWSGGALRARCIRRMRSRRVATSIVLLGALLTPAVAIATTPPPILRVDVARSSAEPASAAPSGPTARPGSGYIVRRGDSLWSIARSALITRNRIDPTSAEIDRYWRHIYEQNRDVIGPDPGLIFPGQLLELPA